MRAISTVAELLVIKYILMCTKSSDTAERARIDDFVVFTALHGMQTRSSDEILSVRPSVSLSVCISHACNVHCDKTVERSVQIVIYEKSFSFVF